MTEKTARMTKRLTKREKRLRDLNAAWGASIPEGMKYSEVLEAATLFYVGILRTVGPGNPLLAFDALAPSMRQMLAEDLPE